MKICITFFAFIGIILADSGFGYLQIANDGKIFTSDYRGTGIYQIGYGLSPIGEPQYVRGRHATLWNDFLLFKKITSAGQIPCIYDIPNRRTYEIFSPVPSCGVPQPLGDTLIIPCGHEILIWSGDVIQKTLYTDCSIQWVSVDTVHRRIAYIDDDGYIVIRGIDDDSFRKISLSLGYKPIWSPDGTKIAILGSDGVMIIDISTGEIWKCKEGLNFVWSGYGDGLFIQKTRYKYLDDIIYSDIVYFSPGIGEQNLTDSGNFYEAMPTVSPDGSRIAFITIPDGDIYSANIIYDGEKVSLSDMKSVIDGFDCPNIPYIKHYNGSKSDLWVPYLHQCYDVQDDFNGSASCGPTSALMAIQRYNKLPAHTISCSWPYVHTHDFGWYVPNEYEFDGFVFDHPGLAPRVSDYYSDTTVYGAHGLCCSPTTRTGTYGDSLVFLINHHDLYSCWLNGTEYVVSWSTYTGEIDNGYPVPALLPGHYNCFRGYFTDHVIISNDPYGDHNEVPRKNYNGAGCYYDWSGYDNGYWEASIRFLFAARGTYVPNPADTIIDDLSAGFSTGGPGNYWRAWLGGYDSHAYWTGSVASGDDVNFATWTPVLPGTGEYEIFVYIPNNYATAHARYQIHHSGAVDTVIIDQSVYSNEWVSLGIYSCNPGDYVYVGDVTGTAGNNLGCDAVWFSSLGSGIIVDDGDSEFNSGGNWNAGASPEYGWNNDYLWCNAADTIEDWARWTPNIPDSGVYNVYMWWLENSNRCDSMFVRVFSTFNDSLFISQKGTDAYWHFLGQYKFQIGTAGYVGCSDRTAVDGDVVIADAVRWLYIGNVDTLVDDIDAGCHRYADPSYWHDGTGGYGGHFYWTYSTDAADTCHIEWRPTIPHPAQYEVLTYIPDNHGVANAHYRIFSADGEDTVVINQSAYSNEWISLGTYKFTGASDEKVYLGDATGTSGNYIAFDAIWWHNTELIVSDDKTIVPEKLILNAYPNPFNSSCKITIEQGVTTPCSPAMVEVYDIRGNIVGATRRVAQQKGDASHRPYIWTPDQSISSGIYFVRATMGDGRTITKRIAYIR
ncbi:T9SS type A sorting domain-containing protein [bacterium]|nr:T9SS type A sorting domain-containing protein [bacterium]